MAVQSWRNNRSGHPKPREPVPARVLSQATPSYRQPLLMLDGPPFLTVLVHRPDAAVEVQSNKHVVGLTGLCAGYDSGAWRCQQLAEYLIETWLPEFSLRYSELTRVTPRNMGRLMRRAAQAVYRSKKFRQRGEFGELLLHAALAQVFDTLPAVSKIYYKDGPNDTVKGFDAVHVVAQGSHLELWLGEAKFYGSISSAIGSAAKSLAQLDKTDYLKDEFAAIVHKIDDQWPHADKLKHLLDRNTSLDKVFASACVAVLLTYDSATVASHEIQDSVYIDAVTQEWEHHHAVFAGRRLPRRFKLHLFLVPLATKADLVKALDKELRRWQ